MAVDISTSCQHPGCGRTARDEGITIVGTRQPDGSMLWLCSPGHFDGLTDEQVAGAVDAPAAALKVQDGDQVRLVPDLDDVGARLDTHAVAAVTSDRLAAAFAAIDQALRPLAIAGARVLAEMEAAGVDPALLATGPVWPEWQACGCLCPLHRADGMGCEGEATMAVQLVGGAVQLDQPVAMCGWCSGWWQHKRPHRVDGVQVLEHVAGGAVDG